MLATQNEVDAREKLREKLMERLAEARRHTDLLFNVVKPDSLYERPIPERHRIVFYIGHLEAFDWNLLSERVFGRKSFHPDFDRLFAFGIDPVGGGLPDDQPSDWPVLAQVRDYARKSRQTLDGALLDEGLLKETPEASGQQFSLNTLLNVAIEHRLMHGETLAYMLHQLPLSRKVSRARPASPHSQPVVPRMIDIPEGTVTLGLPRDSEKFGWDNEYESHTVDVSGFAIDQYKVTNRQYFDFLQAGGYETRAFWTDDDWNWKAAKNISHPIFWRHVGDQWLYRGMFDETSFAEVSPEMTVLDAPVFVSHAEANAYARWAGKQLPTEAEWHRAAYGSADGPEREYPWGSADPTPRLGNFDFAGWDPTPVNAFPGANSAFGVADLLGNGWEWTSTLFAPFPGFEPFPFYRGYSADFFDAKHFVMKGGSMRTAACMLRPSFRNWFQPHYQYVYAGFRCVRR
jgi:iron(II)-dependent oxidoreductase